MNIRDLTWLTDEDVEDILVALDKAIDEYSYILDEIVDVDYEADDAASMTELRDRLLGLYTRLAAS